MKTMNSNQSEAALCRVQAKLFSAVDKACKKTPAGRLLGLPLFVANEFLECAKSCCKVAERFFKGCLNVGNALKEKDEEARKNFRSKAFTQFSGAALHTLAIALRPLFLLDNSLIPIFLLFRGSSFTEEQVRLYKQQANDLMLSDEEKKAYANLETKERKTLNTIIKDRINKGQAPLTFNFFKMESVQATRKLREAQAQRRNTKGYEKIDVENIFLKLANS
ncbi:hypothetical protein PHSC3_001191 [Chlamydiales bacterium STE3]|nr:hypothetical protein PHSC3_001191 [Chlamydiales bacterium STE3]